MYGFVAALMLVAFIASIVLTVIGYKRFVIGSDSKLNIDPRDQRTWGPFLNFDTLIIDRVIKALYMFNAIFLALATVVGVIAALFAGFEEFLLAVLGGAILLAVGELLLRLFYELVMMTVVIARNTSAIKRELCKETRSPTPMASRASPPLLCPSLRSSPSWLLNPSRSLSLSLRLRRNPLPRPAPSAVRLSPPTTSSAPPAVSSSSSFIHSPRPLIPHPHS